MRSLGFDKHFKMLAGLCPPKADRHAGYIRKSAWLIDSSRRKWAA